MAAITSKDPSRSDCWIILPYGIGVLNGSNLGDATHHSNIGDVDNMAETAESVLVVLQPWRRVKDVQKLIFCGLPIVIPPSCVKGWNNLACHVVVWDIVKCYGKKLKVSTLSQP